MPHVKQTAVPAPSNQQMKTVIELAREAGNDDLFDSMQIAFLERFAERIRAGALAPQPAPVQRPVWVDVAIRGDMARAVFDAIRVAVPGLGPWQAFDAFEVQRMADALKPYVPFIPQPSQQCNDCNGMGFQDGKGDKCQHCSGSGVQPAELTNENVDGLENLSSEFAAAGLVRTFRLPEEQEFIETMRRRELRSTVGMTPAEIAERNARADAVLEEIFSRRTLNQVNELNRQLD